MKKQNEKVTQKMYGCICKLQKKGFSTDTEDKYEYRRTRKVITRTRLRIARRSSGQWGKNVCYVRL